MRVGNPAIRAQVIAEAESWLRTPFCHQATVKGGGVGCGTLLMAVYAASGVSVPSIDSLGHFPHDWHLHERAERYLEIIQKFTHPIEAPAKGDIALFQIGNVFAHSAIVNEWPARVIHVMWQRTVEYADASKAPLAKRKVIFLSPFL